MTAFGTVILGVQQSNAVVRSARERRCCEHYSAGCNALPAFFGAIQNAGGRSNRKFAPALSAIHQIASAPATPTIVTTSETAPILWIRPVFSNSVRVVAIGRKNAR